jgi:Xaa-Pro dipeptidase
MDKSIAEALELFPPDEYPSFLPSEFEARIDAARNVMRDMELDAILVTSEANFRYMTGYILQAPVQIARPRYFVLPLEGEPCAIVPKTNVDGMRRTTWVRDIRSWVAPCPEDDGVTLVADALRGAGRRFGQLGAELGQEARLGMPVLDFLRLRDLTQTSVFRDAESIFRRIRMVKSSAEIDRIRRICRIVSDSFEALPGLLRIGDTEWNACRRMQLDLVMRGAHRTPHLVGVSGPNGYTNINTGPTARVLERGSLLTIDAGCCFDNYWCDFNRNFAFGGAIDPLRRAYDLLFKATDAGLAAARPGQMTSDLFAAMGKVLSGDGPPGGTVGRMGHGIGLLAPEPPSLNATDHTVLTPGMVITLEPSMSFVVPGPHGPESRIMAHEENLVITNDGYELLTTRAPSELPVIAT